MAEINGLTRDDLGHLNYLRRVLMQPRERWDGFFEPLSENMNFALRFQLAFAGYAVAALGLRTPAYRAPYAEALGAAVERMLDVRAWGYWRVQPQPAGESNDGGGHVAVMLSPHRRATTIATPPPGDPIAQDNVQFSGHLGTLLGLYERASDDHRYDEPFTLHDPLSGVAYSYTHSGVAGRIHEQMQSNYFHGVACEPSCAYVPCNNHAMSSNTMHDATHGTDFAAANKEWIAWVRRKMVLKGAAVRGLFGACFLRDMGAAAPVAFQFTDSWGLAFLQPFDRALARKLYPTFRRRISRAGDEAHVGSASLSEKMEISDVALNTAFALVAARGLGDEETAAALQRYADNHLAPGWDGAERSYTGAVRTLHTTAVLALGHVAADGTMHRLFHEAPPARKTPELRAVTRPDGTAADEVGVMRAEYKSGKLELELLDLEAAHGVSEVVLSCANMPCVSAITLNATPLTEWRQPENEGNLELRIPLEQQARIEIIV